MAIINPEQEKGLTAFIDNEIGRALVARPQRDQYASVKQYNVAIAQYRKNWLSQAIGGERDSIVKEGVAEADIDITLRDRIGDPANADPKADSLRNRLLKSLETGEADPEAPLRQQGVMNSLWSMDWMGAVQGFLRSIPIVGDLLATGKEMLRMVTNGEGFSFGTAWNHAKLRRALGGAADTLGLSGNAREQFVEDGVNAYDHPERMPAIPGAGKPVRAGDASPKLAVDQLDIVNAQSSASNEPVKVTFGIKDAAGSALGIVNEEMHYDDAGKKMAFTKVHYQLAGRSGDLPTEELAKLSININQGDIDSMTGQLKITDSIKQSMQQESEKVLGALSRIATPPAPPQLANTPSK